MNKKIIIGNTKITIAGISLANEDLYRKFKNRLSVWSESKNGGVYVSWKAYIENEDEDTIIIHKGINLYSLKYYFPDFDIEYDDTPNPSINITGNLIIAPRNKLQKDTITYLNENKNTSQMFICLKPGSGKTYCTINYIMKKKITPIIIVDTNQILEQWKSSFLKFTDLEESDIFTIAGSITINRLMKRTNKPKIYLAMHRTLQSYCDDNWEKIDDLFSKLGIGIKVFDEAHVEWRNIFYIDINSNIKYTLYLTATPNRSNPSEKDCYKMMFGGTPMYGYEESRTDKYIRFIDYHWNSKPNINQQASMKGSYGFDSNVYNDYLLENKFDEFSKLLEELINTFNDKIDGRKIAIVVNCNNMISELSPVFSILYSDVGIFCGLIPKKDRKKELDHQIILTTLKGFNKAVDVKDLAVVINTINISSDVLMEQISGRLRYNKDYKSYFVQLTDDGFARFRLNGKIRIEIMQEIAHSIRVIE